MALYLYYLLFTSAHPVRTQQQTVRLDRFVLALLDGTFKEPRSCGETALTAWSEERPKITYSLRFNLYHCPIIVVQFHALLFLMLVEMGYVR